MLLRVEHRFAFSYDSYISESFLELRVQPKPTHGQTVRSFRLEVGPSTRVFRYRDWNDNLAHHFTITKFHDRIEVVSRSLVETHQPPVTLDALDTVSGDDVAWSLRDFLQLEGPIRLTPALREVHRAITAPKAAPVGEQLRALAELLRREFVYRQDVTRYDSTTEDFLKLRAGVCQDFAHLALALLRMRGIPSRYVSGYLHVERTPDGPPAQSHAWVEIYTPSAGWVPFDPTHGIVPDERYVVVGHGRHYDDVPPNRGIYRGSARESLAAAVYTDVARGRTNSAFQEEIAAIDLPVFTEMPYRRPERPSMPYDAAAEQQQQQQQ
jgi:transglutaminase-like putative cysteine protease